MPRQCAVCGKELHDAWDSPMCAACRGIQYLCEEHAFKCVVCGKHFCPSHIHQYQGQHYCSQCLAQHRVSEQLGYTPVGLYYVPRNAQPNPWGYIPQQFSYGRRLSQFFLFHQSLRGKYAYGVKVFKNKKGTAWIIKPNGDLMVLVLEGSYHTRGRWATDYKGYYWTELLVPEQCILYKGVWRSRGGGLGAKLAVLALPVNSPRNMPVAKIVQRLTWEETSKFVLTLDGSKHPVEAFGEPEPGVELKVTLQPVEA